MIADADDPAAPPPSPSAEEDAEDCADALSPSIRKLVRQYGVDVSSIRGSGPDGRLRIGDVMAALGGRSGLDAHERGSGEADALAAEPSDIGAPIDAVRATSDEPLGAAAEPDTGVHERAEAAAAFDATGGGAATTIFECDLAGIAAHRLRSRERGTELSVLSYFAVACARALDAVPEANGGHRAVHLGIDTILDGEERALLIRNARELTVEAVEGELRASANAARGGCGPESRDATGPGSRDAAGGESRDAAGAESRDATGRESRDATLRIVDYGAAGSVLALPTPLAEGHVASVGIGRPRRGIAVRRVEGEEVLRAATLCYVALTFRPAALTLARATAYLREVVRVVESWPRA
ncbi:MAG TPA: E3 binding domain-containing protein [Gammaproteobacteria bacterium]|nr:E3 binding domain-containing protein [Gammaproteobacteria bacterium]